MQWLLTICLLSPRVIPNLAKYASSNYKFFIAFVKALQVKLSQPSTVALEANRLLDSCINIVLPLWDVVVAHPHHVVQHDKVARVTELLDLCISTRRTPQCKVVLAGVFKSKGAVSAKFTDLYIPLIPRMRQVLHRHDMSLLSDPFAEVMQIFVATYLNGVLGSKSKTPKLNVRQIGCGCGDCEQLDNFMTGNLSRTLIRLPMARKSHLEQRLRSARDLASYHVVTTGFPHGLDITKSSSLIKSGQWASRVSQARAFLAQVGDQPFLKSLMGRRYPDIEKALTGIQPFILPINIPSSSTPSVVPPLINASASATPSSSALPSARAAAPSNTSSNQSTVTTGVKRKKKRYPDPGDEIIDLCSD